MEKAGRMRRREAEAWSCLCAPRTSSVTSDGDSATPPRFTLILSMSPVLSTIKRVAKCWKTDDADVLRVMG